MVGHLQCALLQLSEEDEVVGQAKAMDKPGLEIRALVLGIVQDSGDQTPPGVCLAGLEEDAGAGGLRACAAPLAGDCRAG